MGWVKLDDQIGSHQKIVKVGPAAAWLWVSCIAYAQSHHTDGVIPAAIVPELAGFRRSNAKQLLRRLLDAHLLDRVPVDGHGKQRSQRFVLLRVHDYLLHNASAEQREAKRISLHETRVLLGRKGGLRSGQVRAAARVNPARSNEATDRSNGFESNEAKRSSPPLPSPPLRTKKEADAPTARSADRTNTAGNGSGDPRRVAPDAAQARASAPVARPSVLTPAMRKRFGLD